MPINRSSLSLIVVMVVAAFMVFGGLEMSSQQASAAGRYHMRVRTEQFFNRAAPASTKVPTSGLPSFDHSPRRSCPTVSSTAHGSDHHSK